MNRIAGREKNHFCNQTTIREGRQGKTLAAFSFVCTIDFLKGVPICEIGITPWPPTHPPPIWKACRNMARP